MIARNFPDRIHHLLKYRRQVISLFAVSMAVISLLPVRASAVLQDSVWVVTFAPGDALETKLKKAAHVRPSPAQTKWMEREKNAFMHYGMDTFHGSDWGTGSENPKDFAPMQQNPDQWAKVIKDTKLTMVVPTAKHHDGFCIWNTATTEHCIRNATVTTDVIDAFHKGLVKQGVDLGIYLSPWDMNQDAKGVWRDSVAYNKFFINQLKELIGGNYGPIGELWFDGAVAPWIYPIFALVPQYRPNRWYDTIEVYQPMAVIRMYDPIYYSGTATDSSEWQGIKNGTQKLKWRGKEVRPCGNESGSGRADEWCVQPVFTRFFAQQLGNNDLGLESYYQNAVGAVWYESEVNTSVAVDWHYHTQSYQLKSLSTLKTIYYNSVGNDASLLLNVLPDTRGLIPDDQVKLVRDWTNWIDSTFTKNWAKGATATVTANNAGTPEASGHEADKIIDNKRHTYWTTSGTWNIGTSNATITFDLKTPQTFDNVMIKEYVYNGQRVAGWNLEYLNASNAWTSLVTGKKVIGYKRICKFNQVTASKVRLNITRSWDNPEISNFALFRTLSGIDTTQEDTSRATTGIAPFVKTASISIQPKITVTAQRIAIDAMGQCISRVAITSLEGRSVPLVEIRGSHAVSRPLTAGVYLVKIQAGNRTYSNKIAVSR